jgi:uncharacterized membrane protein YozB (DUF420 family)
MTTTRTRPQWRVPAALVLLSFVPVLAGAIRVTELAGGPEVTPDNARFVETPLPVVAHIIGASVFCVLGAFQFMPRLRRRSWHRLAGRLVVACGLVAALSGLWMTLFLPRSPEDGDLLAGFRLVFGTVMGLAIVLAFVAVRRRDFRAHRAWMMRAYAIAMGAGSQAVISGVWFTAVGTPGEVTYALLLGAGWVVNLAVAELIVRKKEIS